MNILFVSSYYKPAFVYGGPVQSLANLCEGLAQAGASVTVFTTNANGSARLDVPLHRPVSVDRVAVSYFPLNLQGLTFFYSSSLARAILERASEFDIIAAETLWGHALIPISAVCSKLHVPYVISARGQLNHWALAKRGLKKKVYLSLIGRRLIDEAAAIYCTDATEAQAINELKFHAPTFVIPNGIPASDYVHRSNVHNWRIQNGIPADAVLLIFLGRLTQIKRPDIVVDVLSAAQSLSQNVHLLMVGPDEHDWATTLKAQASRSGCAEKIHFTGLLNRKDVISALSQSNLLLMPSEIQENFGNSALEAMATGVPILVSEGVPVGCWAEKAGAGRIVPCTKEAFQRAALELLSDPDKLRQMGKRGQDLIQQRFDVSIIAQQMLRQYEAIVASGKPLPETHVSTQQTQNYYA